MASIGLFMAYSHAPFMKSAWLIICETSEELFSVGNISHMFRATVCASLISPSENREKACII